MKIQEKKIVSRVRALLIKRNIVIKKGTSENNVLSKKNVHQTTLYREFTDAVLKQNITNKVVSHSDNEIISLLNGSNQSFNQYVITNQNPTI